MKHHVYTFQTSSMSFRFVLHQEKDLSVILGGNPKTDRNTTVYQLHLEESTFKSNDVCKPITFLREPEPTLFPPTFFAVKRCRKKSMSLTTTSRHPQAYYIWPCHHFHGEAVDGCHPPLSCGPPMLFGRNGPPAAAGSCDL